MRLVGEASSQSDSYAAVSNAEINLAVATQSENFPSGSATQAAVHRAASIVSTASSPARYSGGCETEAKLLFTADSEVHLGSTQTRHLPPGTSQAGSLFG